MDIVTPTKMDTLVVRMHNMADKLEEKKRVLKRSTSSKQEINILLNKKNNCFCRETLMTWDVGPQLRQHINGRNAEEYIAKNQGDYLRLID